MLTLTAGIAEQLLETKDLGRGSLTAQTKLDIISLAELAATLPDRESPVSPDEADPVTAPAPTPEPEPENEPENETEISAAPDVAAVDSDVSGTSDGPDMPDMPAGDGAPAATDIRYEIPVYAPANDSADYATDTAADDTPETGSDDTAVTAHEPGYIPAPDNSEADIALWRQAFSINDLYLFRHELFRDSDALFNSALAEIGRATSPLQVRDIMADRYGIDVRRPAAKEFLNIISSFFS